MVTDKEKVVATMRALGGSFVRALGSTWLVADEVNQQRIEAAFPDVFEKYEILASSQLTGSR